MGLNDLNRKDIVKKNIIDWKPSIVILQETKIQQCNDLLIWQCWSNKDVKWLDSPSQGSSNGIMRMWDSSKVEVI